MASAPRELRNPLADVDYGAVGDVWNGFAGAPPFGDLKPVKKFTDRKTEVTRIWKAIQALTPTPVPEAAPIVPQTTPSSRIYAPCVFH